MEAAPVVGVCAVVVSYYPGLERLLDLIARLERQDCTVIVVDNGSPRELVRAMLARGGGRVRWICQPENQGIAAAQNLGIALARRYGAEYIALFDQDSVPANDLISQLVSVATDLASQGQKIGMVGACYRDERQQNPPPFLRIRGGRLQRQKRQGNEAYVEVDYVIASGSLIPAKTLDAVGVMNEALFIDYVDIEWGLRARARGFRNFGAWDAHLQHALGDEPVRLFGRAYPARSAGRYYYMFRNVWMLFRNPEIPRGWKFVESYRLIFRAAVWGLFARGRRRQNVRAMLRGTRDGWNGVSGPDLDRKTLVQ